MKLLDILKARQVMTQPTPAIQQPSTTDQQDDKRLGRILCPDLYDNPAEESWIAGRF